MRMPQGKEADVQQPMRSSSNGSGYGNGKAHNTYGNNSNNNNMHGVMNQAGRNSGHNHVGGSRQQQPQSSKAQQQRHETDPDEIGHYVVVPGNTIDRCQMFPNGRCVPRSRSCDQDCHCDASLVVIAMYSCAPMHVVPSNFHVSRQTQLPLHLVAATGLEHVGTCECASKGMRDLVCYGSMSAFFAACVMNA
jgi:hypothetical protein